MLFIYVLNRAFVIWIKIQFVKVLQLKHLFSRESFLMIFFQTALNKLYAHLQLLIIILITRIGELSISYLIKKYKISEFTCFLDRKFTKKQSISYNSERPNIDLASEWLREGLGCYGLGTEILLGPRYQIFWLMDSFW